LSAELPLLLVSDWTCLPFTVATTTGIGVHQAINRTN